MAIVVAEVKLNVIVQVVWGLEQQMMIVMLAVERGFMCVLHVVAEDGNTNRSKKEERFNN
ncbi:MAG: hypothetical protein IJA36_10295 [Lachnospiraceae bacterium]|nr:hypothetical protein [Lachnospiraceae bacterium]